MPSFRKYPWTVLQVPQTKNQPPSNHTMQMTLRSSEKMCLLVDLQKHMQRLKITHPNPVIPQIGVKNQMRMLPFLKVNKMHLEKSLELLPKLLPEVAKNLLLVPNQKHESFFLNVTCVCLKELWSKWCVIYQPSSDSECLLPFTQSCCRKYHFE